MNDEIREPARNPCGSCPYRRDVPSGVWAEEEYAKLPPYDAPETYNQPMGLFLCHQQDGRVCAGWAGCHDMDQNLAIRLHAREMPEHVWEAILDYETDVPLWESGAAAAAHGMAGIENPDDKARRTIEKVAKKVQARR
jgi:hypothetical protein